MLYTVVTTLQKVHILSHGFPEVINNKGVIRGDKVIHPIRTNVLYDEPDSENLMKLGVISR